MTMDQSKDQIVKLMQEFPEITTEQWESTINDDLKGADYQKRLLWDTGEGFKVKPYYRAEDLKDIPFTSSLPGEFPFIRGNNNSGNQWLISQEIDVSELGIEQANIKASDMLKKGVDSLWFKIKANMSFTYEEFQALLKNVWTKDIQINFIAYHHALEIVAYWKQLLKSEEQSFNELHATLNFDPLGHLSIYGHFCGCCRSSVEAFDNAARITREVQEFKNVRSLAVTAKHFGNAGSSIVQELAFGLSMGVEYLSQLTQRGLSINEVAPRIRFIFGIGSNYFLEIAKLRAARLLWANIVKAYNPDSDEICKIDIHSVTSDWNKSLYDPYVNLLRSTTESMSAILGGAGSIEVKPFNSIYESPTSFSERIARNQQLVLKEEAILDKTIDPAAGSYYIESLTASIASEAWKLFLKTEEKGGYYLAMKEGSIQSEIEATANKKDQAIANRRETILGTNQYPNFTERLSANIDANVYSPETKLDGDVKPLKLYRASNAFEELRMLTESYAVSNNRPKVFLFTFGNAAMRRARAQFASNFFAVAGFDLIDNNGFESIEQGVNSALKSEAAIVVICSSDEDYAEMAIPVHQQLAGKTITVIAGNPACAADLQSAGIHNFIHVRTNILESLREYQIKLGIRK
jgi:methylmalonyl-CoA mutase